MPFSRESLSEIQKQVLENYLSLFRPLDKTPRHSLVSVFANVDAGMYHQLLGDIDFLADQLFPDTASRDYLRLHWSDRVAPLYAVAAVGYITIKGSPLAAVPSGLVFSSASGKRFYTDEAARISNDGTAVVHVIAEESGGASNTAAMQELTLVSSIPAGIESKALVAEGGISGGTDGESDEAYLTRVLQSLRNTARYGKSGDFASWAVDSSAEVSKAWEFKNFGVFGALLIQVISGNQITGVQRVGNLDIIIQYLNTVAPPVLFTVRTPDLVSLDPVIGLLPLEDTLSNRSIVENRLKTFLQATAAPGSTYTAGLLRDAIIDGVTISSATVELAGSSTGKIDCTILQYPILGAISWV